VKPIRVIVADDHELFRAGLRAILRGVEGIEVIGEAGDGREALEMIAKAPPDVLVLDISMPGMNGLEAIGHVAEQFPEVKVMILSMHASEQYVGQALRAGAAGYLLKDSAPIELETAIRAVARGENYLSPAVSKQVVSAYKQQTEPAPFSVEQLTPRQREILQLIAEGKTTKEIAKLLGITVRTTETHRMQLMNRLKIHTVAGLVRCAAQAGLITLD
jgi:DNA-binding NarL/FixJ family response regulator